MQNTTAIAGEARFNAIMAALQRDETAAAIALAEAALAAGEEHPLYLNLSAFRLEQAGELNAAAAKLRRALTIAPKDPLIMTALGRTLSQLGREAEALVCFDSALEFNPRHAPAHHGRGLSLDALGKTVEARQAQMRAADLDPQYPDPLGALADHAMRENRPDVARTVAERALRLQPDQPAAALVMAALEARDGKADVALARVERLLRAPLAPLHRAAAEQLAGEQLDAVGRSEEAMAAFIRANGVLRQVYAPIYEAPGVETAVALSQRLSAYFGAAEPARWQAAPGGADEAGVKGHVFLVGFVRSGTTLLEQVLASHPDVVALEEQATLRALTSPWFDSDEGLDRLATLTEAEADRLRAEYWASVRGFGVDPDGKVFVDKAPLSTLWLPMIAKLFPNARVLLAIRDPRDVVLSAFRHRFLINALTWPFTDVVETARFYDGLMAACDRYRRLLPTPVYQHRHEDLIADFDGEVRRICDFIGVDWTEAMRDFAETARRRDVRTPSRDQVREGLNAKGVGRWRRYGPRIEPILPILQPWVERYGYETGDA